MAALVSALAGLLGLAFGSFGNVVIARVPEGRSVVSPPSACPGCGAPVAPRDNIPVLSWLLLRGRCRACREPISREYPLVEVAGAVLFAVVGWWAVASEDVSLWALPAMLLLAWTALVVAVIDLHTRRIPNALTYRLVPAMGVLVVGAALLEGRPEVALRAALAALAAAAFLLVLALINPRGMGMGDVKYAPLLGFALGYVGWSALLIGLFSAFLLGSLVSIPLLASGRRGRKDAIPFGPFLSAGALVGLLAGPALADAYLRATGLA